MAFDEYEGDTNTYKHCSRCTYVSFKIHIEISRHEIQLICIGFSTVAESVMKVAQLKNKEKMKERIMEKLGFSIFPIRVCASVT